MRSLTLRLLFFNILLVFFPVGGMLILDTYEKQLLDGMERSMVQQGRVLSAALSGRDIEKEGLRILKNLEGRLDSRIRIVNASGELLADSSDPRLSLSSGDQGLLGNAPVKRVGSAADYYEDIQGAAPESLREKWLYQIAVYPLNILRSLLLPQAVPLGSAEYYSNARVLDGPEIQAALEGRYGAWTRYSSGGQRSVNLYSAIPVRQGESVSGAVLVSRSTYRILTDLYSLRLDMVRIFLFSLGAAAVLSLLLARTITIPVKKLKIQAESFLVHNGQLKGEFKQLKTRDEIGDLSRSLYSLSGKLEEHIKFISGFASDVSHEMKNPVAVLRNAVELAEQEKCEDQDPLFVLMKQEITRIQKLLDDLRDISRLDVTLESEPRQIIPLNDFLYNLVDERNTGNAGRGMVFGFTGCSEGNPRIEISTERLHQCMVNLLDNAAGFTPVPGEIQVELLYKAGMVFIRVLDQGPGIPAGMEEKIFDRFYSDRPEDQRRLHSGLGLSIVKYIVEGYGGTVRAANRREGGACFQIELPAGITPL